MGSDGAHTRAGCAPPRLGAAGPCLMRSAWSGARPPEQSGALPQVDAGTTVAPEPWAVVPPARVSPGAAGNDGRVISLLRRPGTAPSQIPAPGHSGVTYKHFLQGAGAAGHWFKRAMAAAAPHGSAKAVRQEDPAAQEDTADHARPDLDTAQDEEARAHQPQAQGVAADRRRGGLACRRIWTACTPYPLARCSSRRTTSAQRGLST